MNIEKELSKLEVARSKLHAATGSLESKIVDKVDFEFSIIIQESDGFILLNAETTGNAPLGACLEAIQRDGILTEESHKKLCI